MTETSTALKVQGPTSYFRKFDPNRKPSWRYDRAQRLISAGKVPHPRRDDEETKFLVKYLAAKSRCQAMYELEDDIQFELADKFQHVWAAERIFASGEDQRVRYELEASILARVPYETIADRLGLETATIRVYEMLFFNVTDKLDQKSYIASTVLADAFMAGLSSRTAEMTAKYFGYFAGPLILDLILNAFDGAVPMPQEPTDIKRWLDHQFRVRMQANAVVGVTYLSASNYNIRTLIEGYQMLLSLQSRERASTGDDNVINHAIKVFAAQNPIPVGTAAQYLPSRPGGTYAQGAIEPRVSELEAMHAGSEPAGLLEYNNPDWDDPKNRRLKGDVDGAATDDKDGKTNR